MMMFDCWLSSGLRQSGQRGEETVGDGAGDTSHQTGGGDSHALLGMSLNTEEKTPLALHSETETEAVT